VAPLPGLPGHDRDPVGATLDDDPILRFGRETAGPDALATVIRDTVKRAPAASEALASREESAAALAEARAVRSPSIDTQITSYQVIGRQFGNSAENVIERARPGHRTDFLVSVDQLLLDAGGASNRIAAASERLRAAEWEVEGQEDRVALDTVGAWYDVFTYRALTSLAGAFVGSQGEVRQMVADRIARGASAPADLARVDSYAASAQARLARFRRQQAQAEARYQALTGVAPPPGIARAAVPPGVTISKDLAVARAVDTPGVRAARAGARAAERDAKAARSDTLPTLSVGLESGRYGIYETPNDYDLRGRVTLRQRLFGGVDARADQARARAGATQARADRTAEEAVRDAEIAWSDVRVLEDQKAALENTYIASRRSRDVVAERFRVASGTLFDVLGAEDSYFETAVGYIQATTELDAARWVLLSRTGGLLAAAQVTTPAGSYRP
jgi:outer membrane protein, adhesin transport system